MSDLDAIAGRIHKKFERLSALRDQAIRQSRELSRISKQALHALHNEDKVKAEMFLIESHTIADQLHQKFTSVPEIYYAGYIRDALVDYVVANVTFDLIQNHRLLAPDELSDIDPTVYVNGLADVIIELRRRVLDILRHGYVREVELCLSYMDTIYLALVTMDYPDAITSGLRRRTDLAREAIEKTRGDATVSLRGDVLVQSLRKVIGKFGENEIN